jgi:hypothetical protein
LKLRCHLRLTLLKETNRNRFFKKKSKDSRFNVKLPEIVALLDGFLPIASCLTLAEELDPLGLGNGRKIYTNNE